MSQDKNLPARPKRVYPEDFSSEGMTWEEYWAVATSPGFRRRLSKQQRDHLAHVLWEMRRENREAERLEAIEKAAAKQAAAEKAAARRAKAAERAAARRAAARETAAKR